MKHLILVLSDDVKYLGFDLIVISLGDWDVGYARVKIKTILSCGQVQMLIQNNK